jgi:uncharacterized delta-60 repeat protein
MKRIRTTIAAMSRRLPALTAALSLAATCAAQDGTWDPAWAPRDGEQKGIPGLIEDTHSLGGGQYADDMTATAVAVQADGRIVVAGFGWNTSNGTDQNACVLRRFNADGSPDAGFASGGTFVQNWSSGLSDPKTDCYFKALAVQPDGSIVVAGQIVYPVPNQAEGIVERLSSSGHPDPAFAGTGYTKLGIWSDASRVFVAGNGDLIVAGSWIQPSFTDIDFRLSTLGADGSRHGDVTAHFDVPGSAKNYVVDAAALESWSNGTIGNFHSHDEIYLVGVVDNPAWASGLAHHSCGIAAFVRTDGGGFTTDTAFAGGQLKADFAVGASDTDTICRAAVRRAGNGLLGPTGVVVGGERYYTPNGAGVGSASYYALEDISANGTIGRDDGFAFFADLNEAGAFNSIFDMTWDDTGKLVTVGYAGIGAGGNADHAPSDGVMRRFNADYSVDGSFAADHSGTLFASLDTSGASGVLPSQREWANAVAFDPVHARAVFVGERSIWLALKPDLYAWLLGAIHEGVVVVNDRIFGNGFD